MIDIQLTNSNPMDLCGMATKVNSVRYSVVEDTEFLDSCGSSCQVCDCNRNSGTVYGGSSLDWQNDKTSFLFTKSIPTDTLLYELYRNGQLITSNLLDFGSFQSTPNNTTESIIIDWDKVLNNFGSGEYFLRTTLTTLGNDIVSDSDKYNLRFFDICDIEGKIKIETFLNGCSLRSNITYDNYYNSIISNGNIKVINPELEQDIYETSSRIQKSIQTSINKKYEVELYAIKYDLLEYITSVDLLSDNIYITNFNIKGVPLVQKRVLLKDVDIDDDGQSGFATVTLTFEESEKNNILRKCC